MPLNRTLQPPDTPPAPAPAFYCLLLLPTACYCFRLLAHARSLLLPAACTCCQIRKPHPANPNINTSWSTCHVVTVG